MRAKTEEVEKLRIEIKDLKEILKLKDELEKNDLRESVVEEDLNDGKENPWTSMQRQNNSKKKVVDQMQNRKYPR